MTLSVSGERGPGLCPAARDVVHGQGGAAAALLPLLHRQPAGQLARQPLHQLQPALRLLVRLVR